MLAEWKQRIDPTSKLAQRIYSDLEAARDLYAKALREVGGAEAETRANNRYSLMEFEDGVRFVDVKTDQQQFDKLADNEKSVLAKKIIKEKFQNKVIGIDNKVFVNGRTVGEYAYPVKSLDGQELDAKMRASSELDNIIDAGRNWRTETDGKDGHIHPDLVNGFDKADVIFKVAGEYYDGVINVKNIAKGKLLKDVTQIKNVTNNIISSYGENPKSYFVRDVSLDSISRSTAESQDISENSSGENRKSYDDIDDTYLSAVESGDMETASRMVADVAQTYSGASGVRSIGERAYDVDGMDAPADVAAWNRGFPDAEGYFDGCETNEDCFLCYVYHIRRPWGFFAVFFVAVLP